ncbi:hypothetical protein, partial [Bacillus sp. WP8]|uniref:hypothetical protein n=1 Tax=Bacillus sp. WP8 TaxID=756828 RepID=UPI001C92C6DD
MSLRFGCFWKCCGRLKDVLVIFDSIKKICNNIMRMCSNGRIGSKMIAKILNLVNWFVIEGEEFVFYGCINESVVLIVGPV